MKNNVTFEFFFKKVDYFISQGKGFSLYSSTQNNWLQFIDKCKTNHIHHSIFYCSSFEEDSIKTVDSESIAIIIQDLPIKEYQSKVAVLADKLFFQLWYEKCPICFFSVLDESNYKIKNISSADIHSNYQTVIDFLMLEQINNLLSFNSIQFSSPEFLTLSAEKTIFTPIEQKILDEFVKENIAFVPQARIGRFFVDFLVSIGKEKIIIECDGREFHNPVRDKERDKVLSLEKYPILRFSGAKIAHNVTQCVEIIKNASKNNIRSNFQIDDDIDEDQREGIDFITGPVRILAPAGSGKTKTLTNRIANLINNGIPQEKILALAFNKKAQEEMQNRLLAKQITDVNVRTFHSLGMEIIRTQLGWSFEGNNEKKITRELLRSAVDENLQLPHRRNKDPLSEFLEALRIAKMELPPLAQMEVEIDDKVIPFEMIFNSYLKKQTSHNFFNFDDMIYLAVRLLIDYDEIRQDLQTKYEYVLVDEYQDLNKTQLLFLQILSLPQNNVFVVGDDDQMIYGWRGAEVRNIVDFHKRFSIIQDCVLSTNYRSSKSIVRHSRWLIDNNQDRVPKDIHACLEADEGLFEIHPDKSLWEQAQFAAEWISNLKVEQKLKWKNFAVLFRYNAFEVLIAMALDKINIPHTPVNNLRLFKSRVGKDIIAYLSVILYPDDAKKEEYFRILSRPNKYLKNEIIQDIQNRMAFQDLPNRDGLRDWEVEKLRDFLSRIEILRNQANLGVKPNELILALANEFGLKDFYLDQSQNAEDLDTASDDMLLDVIQSISSNYENINTFYQMIDKASKDETETENDDAQHRDEIVLSTVHKSKGKEFENAVFLNLSQEKRKKTAFDIEEERRVAYVGITRAKKRLLVTFITTQPSQFVKEMALNPEFSQKSNTSLRSYEAKTKFEILKLENELKIINHKKNALISKFPELQGGEMKLPTSFNFINRLLLWIYQKRLSSAFKKFGLLEEESSELITQHINPKKEEIIRIQTEINFRGILGQIN